MLAEIPSPTTGVWWLGPFPIRAYAFCILLGIGIAIWWTQRRFVERGGTASQVSDIVLWALPFGIVGARLYHLITSPQAYFGEGGHPWNALRIWDGGLGMWGAFALGALGAWIACRRRGVSFSAFASAAAPGAVVAQGIGRFGNWFNNEVHGRATDLPWGLKVYEWDQSAGHAVLDANGDPVVLGTFHPTFLYEALWCFALAAALVWAERRWRFRGIQTFALAISGYCVGRFVMELLRDDEANRILGLRVNVWVSALVFVLGLWLFRVGGRGPETDLVTAGADDGDGAAAADDEPAAADDAEESEVSPPAR